MHRIIALLIALVVSGGAARAQATADLSESTPLFVTQAIPTTDLVIDMPVTWNVLPSEAIDGAAGIGTAGDGIAIDETLIGFGNAAEGSSAVILISRASDMTRPPLAEMELIENGIRMSRWPTWIVNAGMEIVTPAHAIDLGGVSGASVSFLSGQPGNHDVVSMTLIEGGGVRLLIVDIAPRGSDDVRILAAMREVIRPG